MRKFGYQIPSADFFELESSSDLVRRFDAICSEPLKRALGSPDLLRKIVRRVSAGAEIKLYRFEDPERTILAESARVVVIRSVNSHVGDLIVQFSQIGEIFTAPPKLTLKIDAIGEEFSVREISPGFHVEVADNGFFGALNTFKIQVQLFPEKKTAQKFCDIQNTRAFQYIVVDSDGCQVSERWNTIEEAESLAAAGHLRPVRSLPVPEEFAVDWDDKLRKARKAGGLSVRRIQGGFSVPKNGHRPSKDGNSYYVVYDFAGNRGELFKVLTDAVDYIKLLNENAEFFVIVDVYSARVSRGFATAQEANEALGKGKSAKAKTKAKAA